MSITFYSDANVGEQPAHYRVCMCAELGARDLEGVDDLISAMVLDDHQPDAADLALLGAAAVLAAEHRGPCGCKGRGCHRIPARPALHEGPNWSNGNAESILRPLGLVTARDLSGEASVDDLDAAIQAGEVFMVGHSTRKARTLRGRGPTVHVGGLDAEGVRTRHAALRAFLADARARGATKVWWA